MRVDFFIMATKITTQGVLYINGKQVENLFRNITSLTKKLRRELATLPVGTKKFKKKRQNLKKLKHILQT